MFWINVPAVCLTLAAGAVLVPESRNPAAPPLDVPGALLSAAAVTCLIWGVINGPERGWTAPATWMLLAGSAVLLAGFAVRELRTTRPLVDPGMFGDRRFTWGTAATVAVQVALFGTMFWSPSTCRACRRRPDRRGAAPAADDGGSAGGGAAGVGWRDRLTAAAGWPCWRGPGSAQPGQLATGYA